MSGGIIRVLVARA